MPSDKQITKQLANGGVPIDTTKSSELRLVSPKIEILVGGPYTLAGEDHPYGHTALRVISSEYDVIYDFGRYGNTWGIGDSEGDGILNIWTDFSKYIASENSIGRLTTGYVYLVPEANAAQASAFFLSKISGKNPIKDIGYMKRYKLDQDYNALSNNCTTISFDGAQRALPNISKGSDQFIEGEGLGFKEKTAAKLAGWPKNIFMPADLSEFLKKKSSPNKINNYGSKK